MQMRLTATILNILCLSFYNTQAATYTAISSGNFSSSATWAGSLVPPTSISGDIIVIPNGININMNQDLVLQSASSITVNGSLTGATGKFLFIGSSSLGGNGTIDVDSFSADFTSGFSFTGNLSAGVFYSTNAMINAAATVLIKNSLLLSGGITTIAQGNLNFSPNATIKLSGGTLSVIGGGAANLNTAYNVVYKNVAPIPGIELTGSGLTDLTIDIPATSKLMLSNNLSVNGMLSINSGILDLNSHDLTLDTNADFFASGAGMSGAYGGMDVSSSSSLYINAKNGLTGGLELVPKSTPATPYAQPQLKNLTINTDPGKFVRMGSPWDLQILGVLDLKSGLLDYGHITLVGTATISGGGPSSYVVTSQTTVAPPYAFTNYYHLSMPVPQGTTRTFPIGTLTRYAPCTITNNGSNINTINWIAGVCDVVRDHGMNGILWSPSLPLVAATWSIWSGGGAPVTADITVIWDAGMEVNSFNRNNAYVTEYDDHGVTLSGSWDLRPTTPVSLAPNGMYGMKRSFTNSQMGGLYSVFEQKTLSVNDVKATGDMHLYPNPNNGRFTLKGNTQTDEQLNITVINAIGQVIYSQDAKPLNKTLNKEISLNGIASGIYMLKVSNQNGTLSNIKMQVE